VLRRASVSTHAASTGDEHLAGAQDVLRSPGQSLDSATRAFFEPRFGHDFGRVRVHADAGAADAARAVNARAYTAGRDIVFGAGEYAPQATQGRRLLAHELAHVVQQGSLSVDPATLRLGGEGDPAEVEAERAADAIDAPTGPPHRAGPLSPLSHPVVQRTVRPESVSCRQNGLTNPDLTGPEAVATIEAADADAIALAQQAEASLAQELAAARAGTAVDAALDTILQEELGLSLANPAQFGLVQQQIDRIHRVRETLESGYLGYVCRGGATAPTNLVGCTPLACGDNFAFSCPGNRLVVLCQAFWDTPDEQGATLLHEPFHIWFHMARHAPNALRRADASCFESFALRVSGRAAPASCVDHTAG
jgi:hypothetical protein